MYRVNEIIIIIQAYTASKWNTATIIFCGKNDNLPYFETNAAM